MVGIPYLKNIGNKKMDNARFVLFVFFSLLSVMLYQQWQQDYGPKPALTGAEVPGEAASVPEAGKAA